MMIRRGARRALLATIALVSLAGGGAADARPHRHDARAAFDRGVVAYQKGNYEAAAEALGKSFELEADVDTLFAWAQAERKLERCDKASELYEMLLSYALPEANKTAVEQKLAECRAVTGGDAASPPTASRPASSPAAVRPATSPGAAHPAPPPEPDEPHVSPDPAAPRAAAEPRSAGARGGPPGTDAAESQPRGWYRDPVALTLLGAGAAASVAGTWLLVSARSMSDDANGAAVYQDALDLRNKARRRGAIGAVSAISGAALAAGGIAWILLRPGSTERHTVSGWLLPGGGGMALAGSF